MSKRLTPERVNEPVRPEVTPHTGLVNTILSHAPELTRNWGAYTAFVAVITIFAIVVLPLIKNETAWVLVVIVLAGLWSPLVAKRLGLLD